MKAAVILFPGSNCDRDAHLALRLAGLSPFYLWHEERDIRDAALVVLPGGFSYGDYLRAGAIARFSPVMEAVVQFAGEGGLVLGICNGFQMLCEAGLLPGALLLNQSGRFVCRTVELAVESRSTPFTRACPKKMTAPVAHAEGRYWADDETLDELEGGGRVLFRYRGESPNGAARDIAGVVNETGNVLGMMPHPERNCEPLLGDGSGLSVFSSLRESLVGTRA